MNARRRDRDAEQRKRGGPGISTSAARALAIRTGDVETVRGWLASGARPEWPWVCETMRNGHLPLAELLLLAGAERNLFSLAAVGDRNGVRTRLQEHPEEARQTVSLPPACVEIGVLHVACGSDLRDLPRGEQVQVEIVGMLHERGADVNATAYYRGLPDATPLFSACWSSGNVALLRWLIEAGAEPAPAALAAALGHFQRHTKPAFELAEVLVQSGVSLEAPAGERSLLQAFSNQGALRTVAWLLARGAEVHARGPAGRSAAHFAAERNTGPATLALLAEHGADLTARDDDGRTPSDLARLHGKTRTVDWLMAQSG